MISLFIFQSLWNVAAAFCLHDEQAGQLQRTHFGHHQPTLCSIDQVSDHEVNQIPSHSSLDADINQQDMGNEITSFKTVSASDTQSLKLIDHQDHLPSMSSIIMQQLPIHASRLDHALTLLHQFYWSNAYQSPQLTGPTPPPEFSPLSVG